MTRFGAIAAYGIIDAGGRNVTVGSGFPQLFSFFEVSLVGWLEDLYSEVVETLMFEVEGNFENGSLEPGAF